MSECWLQSDTGWVHHWGGAKVVHRDVKPANLLVTAGWTVKVADFGIAHLPGEGTTALKAAGQIIGSTLYIAPERTRGALAGEPADVYSLGCAFYQLVTGRPPFQAEHPTAVLYQHVDAPPEPPSLVRPEFGGPLENVPLRLLAKDPADRPTAAELAAGALRGQPLRDDFAPVVVLPGTVALNEPATGPLVLDQACRLGCGGGFIGEGLILLG